MGNLLHYVKNGIRWILFVIAFVMGLADGVKAQTLSPAEKASIQHQLRVVEYNFSKNAEQTVYYAPNRAQDLGLRFDAGGMTAELQNTKSQFHLQLTGYGYENNLTSVRDPQIVTNENTVEYRWGDLIEWYVNTELGVKQALHCFLHRKRGVSTRVI